MSGQCKKCGWDGCVCINEYNANLTQEQYEQGFMINELIQNVLQWGIDKNIIGAKGKGTCQAQANKMLEEAVETYSAVKHNDLAEVKDGIGDTAVTLILLAEMYGWTLEECLEHAYNVIAGRTGKMVDGVFVKDKK
jgi:NTP pyrophosphatase (non-canonical NTP hydrolase)